ncbi:histidine phosphatase family protein [Patescibacteria group bacterium]
MKPTLVLVARQGGTKWHDNEQVIGKQDAELSLPGLRRAEGLAKLLTDRQIDTIYTSRLGRAMDTGKTVAKYHKLKIRLESALDERGLGVLEGKKKKEIARELERLRHKEEFIEGGESGYDFECRVIGFLEKCLTENEGKTILIISHEGPVKVIHKYLTRFDTTKKDNDCQAPLAGISEFGVRNIEPLEIAIKVWDGVNHLN